MYRFLGKGTMPAFFFLSSSSSCLCFSSFFSHNIVKFRSTLASGAFSLFHLHVEQPHYETAPCIFNFPQP